MPSPISSLICYQGNSSMASSCEPEAFSLFIQSCECDDEKNHNCIFHFTTLRWWFTGGLQSWQLHLLTLIALCIIFLGNLTDITIIGEIFGMTLLSPEDHLSRSVTNFFCE